MFIIYRPFTRFILVSFNPKTPLEYFQWVNLLFPIQTILGGTITGTLYPLHGLCVLQGVPADSQIVDAWKLCNSIFSFFAVVCVYRYYVLRELFQRIDDHLNRGIVLGTDVKVTTIMCMPAFWVEIILMAVHLPPYTSFLWLTDNMGAPHVYRGETIMCLLNTLRIYPMMRVIR